MCFAYYEDVIIPEDYLNFPLTQCFTECDVHLIQENGAVYKSCRKFYSGDYFFDERMEEQIDILTH